MVFYKKREIFLKYFVKKEKLQFFKKKD